MEPKKQKREEISFQASEDKIIELVVQDNISSSFCVWDRKKETFEIVPELGDANFALVPPFMQNPSGGQLVKKGVILLPSEPEPYESESTLLAEIENFINTYSDVGKFFEKLSTYYVLFTWAYDLFNTVPYLRSLGDFGTGKTRYLDVMGAICYRSMRTGGATSSSPIFRIIDAYHGTLILDEANFRISDMYVDIVKILNQGFQKGYHVLKSEEVGGGRFEPRAYDCFGPKIVGARAPFKDDALESRFLTHKARITIREDIPIILGPEFWERAQHLRNNLLMWRLKNYGRKFELDFGLFSEITEARIKQIVIPLMAVITDGNVKTEIESWMWNYWQELIAARTETFAYEVLKQVVKISQEAENVKQERIGEPEKAKEEKIRPSEIADIINLGRTEKKKVRPERIGRTLRGLGFKTKHDEKGSYITKEEGLLDSLKLKYGLTVQKPPTVRNRQKESPKLTDDSSDSTYKGGKPKTDSSDSGLLHTVNNSQGGIRRSQKEAPLLSKKPSELSAEPTAQDIGRAVCEYRKTTLAKAKLAELIGVPLDRLKPVLEELEKKGAVRDMGSMVEVM